MAQTFTTLYGFSGAWSKGGLMGPTETPATPPAQDEPSDAAPWLWRGRLWRDALGHMTRNQSPGS